MNFFQSVYRKITGKDTIEKYQSEVKDLTMALVDYKQQCSSLERALLEEKTGRKNAVYENTTLQQKVDALLVERNQLLNQPPKTVYEDRFVMTRQVYDKFVRSVEPPVVTATTTPQGAGFLVGIQRTLEKLREQFVA